MSFSVLPTELLLLISESLGAKEISSLIRTNRSINHILTPLLHEHALQGRGDLPAICWAAKKGHDSLVRLLLNKYDEDPIRYKRCHPNYPYRPYTPLFYATCYGRVSTVTLLIDKGADIHWGGSSGRTLLSESAYAGHIEVVKILLDRGIRRYHQGHPRSSPIFQAALEGNVEVIKLLLEREVELFIPHNTAYSPLWAAVRGSNAAVIHVLVEMGGMSVDSTFDREGSTLLHIAVQNDSLETTKLLLDMGADVNMSDMVGYTPLMRAQGWNDEILCLLVERGADIFAKNNNITDASHKKKFFHWIDSACPCFTSLLMEKLLQIEDELWDNIDQLHIFFQAVWIGHEAIVKRLLTQRIDIHTKNSTGETALHVAVRSKFYTDGMIALLLDMGADVQREDDNRCTPIDAAVELQRKSAARLLRTKMPYSIERWVVRSAPC